MKLSPRAQVLLVLIADHSEIGGKWWVAPTDSNIGQECESLGKQLYVRPGDHRTVEGLEKKGLVEMCGPGLYVARVTEDGRLHVEKLRESGKLKGPTT